MNIIDVTFADQVAITSRLSTYYELHLEKERGYYKHTQVEGRNQTLLVSLSLVYFMRLLLLLDTFLLCLKTAICSLLFLSTIRLSMFDPDLAFAYF